MHKYLNFFIFIIICILFLCCKKNKTTFVVKDISVNTDATFDKVKYIQNEAIIVGGIRFDEANIYRLNEQNELYKIDLPNNASHKEIYGLDISAQGKIIAVGYDASVYVSNDTGKSWIFIQNGNWKNFQAVAFRDADTAYIVSSTGFSLGGIYTIDKDGIGNNIPLIEKNFSTDDIDFVNQKIGYICGYGAILKTIDGGKTWDFTTAQNDYFKSMSWKNEYEGIAVGYAGSIFQTNDGGDTWKKIRNGNDVLIKKIHFTSVENNGNQTYIAVGDKGYVFISINNGNSWSEVENFTSKDLKGIGFKNENEAMIVGEKGALFLIKI